MELTLLCGIRRVEVEAEDTPEEEERANQAAPSQDAAEKAKSRLMVWLDHARTDNSCEQQEKDEANYDSFQCLEAEKQNIEGKIR